MIKAGFLLLISLFVLLVVPQKIDSNAQEMIVETDTPIGVENTSTEGAVLRPARINYELPYPGMLPDNPLYFLKAIRDGLVKRLINDDMKMARFSMLNAEKRTFAMMLLIEKNKDKLAIETMSKGNNYLDDSINAIKKYHKSHPKSADVKPFLLQLDASVLKILEVQNDIKESVDDSYRNQYINENKRTAAIEQNVKSLLRQK